MSTYAVWDHSSIPCVSTDPQRRGFLSVCCLNSADIVQRSSGFFLLLTVSSNITEQCAEVKNIPTFYSDGLRISLQKKMTNVPSDSACVNTLLLSFNRVEMQK